MGDQQADGAGGMDAFGEQGETRAALLGSRLPVGSSAHEARPRTRARAMATRCSSPPRARAPASARSARPTAANRSDRRIGGDAVCPRSQRQRHILAQGEVGEGCGRPGKTKPACRGAGG